MIGPLAVLLMVAGTAAADWRFSPPLEVSPALGAGVYHHLGGSGRQGIAVSGAVVAVAWEDNRSGRPQAYAALRRPGRAAFDAPRRLSAGREAYEPVIAALGDGRFVAAWEQDGSVKARLVRAGALGPVREVAGGAGQISLAATGSARLFAAWSERAGAHRRIAGTVIEVDGNRLRIRTPRPIETAAPAADQLYPAVAHAAGGVTVAWEDRRRGHTVLFYSHAAGGTGFSAPRLLNEPVYHQGPYGRGSGVTRVALASDGSRVAAVWLDKRNFENGYDVYAALSGDGGRRFGRNERVRDDFGANIPQWHAVIALGPGRAPVAAWDDHRDGTQDVFLSWRTPGGWSEDRAVPGASGPGEQDQPVIAMDPRGDLHLAWVHRDRPGGPTRLYYSRGRVR